VSRLNGAPVRYQRVRAIVVAAGCLATGTLKYVVRNPEAYVGTLAIAAIIAAVAVLAVTFVAGLVRWRAWAFGLASWVLLADGLQSLIEQDQRSWSIARTDLFTWALALLALDSMMSYQDAERRARKARS